MDYYQELLNIANRNGLKLSETAYRIANYRQKVDLPLTICACYAHDKRRGCKYKDGRDIKKKCMTEILKDNRCACGCFLKG